MIIISAKCELFECAIWLVFLAMTIRTLISCDISAQDVQKFIVLGRVPQKQLLDWELESKWIFKDVSSWKTSVGVKEQGRVSDSGLFKLSPAA